MLNLHTNNTAYQIVTFITYYSYLITQSLSEQLRDMCMPVIFFIFSVCNSVKGEHYYY